MLRQPAAHDDDLAAMSRSSRFFAWMLVVVAVLASSCSCTARAVCSSRPLAADADGDARDSEPCAAGGAVAAAGSGGSVGGGGGEASSGRREIWNRRSLGDRSVWPPSPLWNRPRTMPAAPPPQV